MKLTTFLLIIALVQASAAGYSQVTLKEKNAPLAKVLNAIEKQANVNFFYNIKDIKDAKVNVQVTNASLKETLDQCLANLQLTYEIKENTVFLSKKEPSFIEKFKDAAKSIFSNIDVQGRVVDEQGLPIPNATVTVKGTTNATISDAKGYFSLKGVDDKSTVLISVIGYEKRELPAKNNVGDIRLVVSTTKLDEVHIIPYGQTSQRLSTGNIGTISAKEIEEQPVSTILPALEGRIPGLFITQANGVNGGGVTVRIQGQNSINGGNYPLYVVDGVPFPSQTLTTMLGGPLGISDGLGNANQFSFPTYGNPLNYINPSDIESISVLKDADATSIYGSLAANGAILITTKKGKSGPARVDVNIQNGWGKITGGIDMMNTQQYLQMRREAFRNNNALPTSNPGASFFVYAPDLTIWDTTRYTDWKKVLIGGTAKYNDINANISGGNANTTYLVGTTFNRNTTVFPGDFADTKVGIHFNINSTSANQKFRMSFTGVFLSDNNFLPQADFTLPAYFLAPDAPPLYNTDGTLNWALNSAGRSTWTNPLASLNNTYENKTSNLQGTAILNYTILPGLEVKTTLGYTNLLTDEYLGNPLTAQPPENQYPSQRRSSFSTNTITTLQAEPQLSFSHLIGLGKLNALLGSTFLQTTNNGLNYNGSGFNSDALLPDILSAATTTIGSTVESVYRYNAIFGRINYELKDKYIFNASLRRDGSSRFGSNNQFHGFWSSSAAWIFSEENVIKENFNWFSFGKLRGSIGTTGNDQIGNYNYLNLYNTVPVAVPYQGIAGLAPNNLPNPDLQWEETRKLSIGLDLGFLKDKILLNVSYNQNRSSNELIPYNYPIVAGFTSVFENFPATIQNTSWELTLNTANVESKNIKWSSSFNLTVAKNKLLSFPGLATSSYNSTLVIGQPVNIVKVAHFLGVDPATGIYRFADALGNPITTPSNADKTVLIDINPQFYGGLQNSFSYKGLQLDVFIQFVKQISSAGQLFGSSISTPGVVATNQPVSVLNHWQKPGDISSIERYNTGSGGSLTTNLNNVDVNSDAVYVDASFIRLKNVSLSYELPVTWKQKMGIRQCRLYTQAQNLLTLSKFPGPDPEASNVGVLPPIRMITIGLQLGL